MRYRDFRSKGEKRPSEDEAGTRASRGGRGSEPPPERRKDRPRFEKDEQEKLAALARTALEGAGFDVVLARATADRRLRLMIDAAEGAAVTVDDCARANRLVLDALAAASIDAGDFEVEVESPGADRPLTRPKDFERFKGKNVTVSLLQDRDGRRNFTGALLSRAEDGALTLLVFDTTEPTTFAAKEIREARLHADVKVPPRERR